MNKFYLAVFLLLFFPSIVHADGNLFSVGEIQESKKIASNTNTINETKGKNIIFFSNKMGVFSVTLFWTILGALIGSVIALASERYKEPKLNIIAEEEANSDNVYPAGHLRAGQRWKFFRVRVKNEPTLRYLSRVISRSTAQQVNAKLRIIELNKTFKGRWASTLELVNASPLDIVRIVNFPDPITLISGESEFLDVFTKYEYDSEAYGWNNEAYLHNWRNPDYKMDIGDYLIEIQVIALSGAQKKKMFRVHIAATIDDTYISELT